MNSNRIASKLKRKVGSQTKLDFYGKVPEWNNFYRYSGLDELRYNLDSHDDYLEDGGSSALEWYQDTIRYIQRVNKSFNELLATVKEEFRDWSLYDEKNSSYKDINEKEVKPYL